jgi:hypothetical protein
VLKPWVVDSARCRSGTHNLCSWATGEGSDMRTRGPCRGSGLLENTGILARAHRCPARAGRKWTLGLKWTTWCKVAPAMSTRGKYPIYPQREPLPIPNGHAEISITFQNVELKVVMRGARPPSAPPPPPLLPFPDEFNYMTKVHTSRLYRPSLARAPATSF